MNEPTFVRAVNFWLLSVTRTVTRVTVYAWSVISFHGTLRRCHYRRLQRDADVLDVDDLQRLGQFAPLVADVVLSDDDAASRDAVAVDVWSHNRHVVADATLLKRRTAKRKNNQAPIWSILPIGGGL